MPISGGKIIKGGSMEYGLTDGRLTSLGVVYKTDYGTYFEMDGDLKMDRELQVAGSVDYVKS